MLKNLLFTFLLISNAIYSQDLSVGLQAYYPFTGNANDASGNNNNPIFNNATLTSDISGNANSAYNFNGINTYMQIPNHASLNMSNQMSLAVKVRPLGFYTGPCYNNMMVMKGDGDYLTGNYSLRFSDAYTGCSINPTTTEERFYGGNVIASNPLVQLNQWYNVVWTYDGTTSRIYVNCVLIDTLVTFLGTFTNGYDVYIGRMNDFQYQYWLNGDLDEVRIYNRVLTQDEVNLYGQCSPAPISITEFNAYAVDNKKVKLAWKTEAESEIKNYSVERSSTGFANDFISIGIVNSKSSSGSNNYEYTDNSAKPNTLYYYRLSINEKDGIRKYSDTKTAKIINKEFYTLIYPNPTSGVIKVNMNNPTGPVDIKVVNELGQVIVTKKIVEINLRQIILDISNSPRGSYWVSIQSGSHSSVEKIIKN